MYKQETALHKYHPEKIQRRRPQQILLYYGWLVEQEDGVEDNELHQ